MDPQLSTQISNSGSGHARLEVRNLHRVFGDQHVVNNVSLKIMPGQVCCLLGPSGCGKSTTLRMIAGIDVQDRGEIYIDGTLISDTVTSMPAERRNIGLMFQDFALFPHMSVGDNVMFGMTEKGDAARQRALELLTKVNLARAIDEYPHVLSGGEQQRVALVRALAPRPRIMLMDEPFSGLDNRLRDVIRDETLALLKEEGTSVLLVTHEPYEAMRMADQIILMREGRVVQSGAPYNIYNSPVDRQAVGFFSDINVIEGCVHGSLAATPFGQFLAPGLSDGTNVEIVFRPQHLRIDFDRHGKGPLPTPTDGTAARAHVKRARFLGRESIVEFTLEHSGQLIQASVPNVFLPKEGTPFWLTVPRDRCFVFPASP